MCITEEKLVEAYGNSSPHERFLLIYKNYSVFPQLVDCYETGLFNRILFEVEYVNAVFILYVFAVPDDEVIKLKSGLK